MTESASSTSGQEFDVFSVMDWKDGVGTLPGSDLKVSCLYCIQLYMCVYLFVFIIKMNLSTYVTQGVKALSIGVCRCIQLLQSCLTLCDPMDCSLLDSSVCGIFPARLLECVAMPSSRGFS